MVVPCLAGFNERLSRRGALAIIDLDVECDENVEREGQKLRHKVTVRQGAARKRDSTPYKSAGLSSLGLNGFPI